LASTGRVFLERCFVATQTGAPAPISLEVIIEQIRATPLAQNVLASDFGMPQYALPVEGMRQFVQALLSCGFSEAEVRALCQHNAARLLRLEES